MAKDIKLKLKIDPRSGKAAINTTAKGLKGLGDAGTKAAKNTTSAWNKSNKALKSTSKAAADMTRVVSAATKRMIGDTKTYAGSVNQANKALKELGKTGSKTAATLNKIKADVKVIGGTGGGARTDSLGMLAALGIGAHGVSKVKMASGEYKKLTEIIKINRKALVKWTKAGVTLSDPFNEVNRQGQQYNVTMDRYRKTQQKLISDVKTHRQELENQKNSIFGLKKSWVKLAGVIAVATSAYALFSKAWDMANISAIATQQKEAFFNLALSVHQSSDQILADLKRVSVGAISEAQLIKSAGTAMLMGLAPDKLSGLMKIARATARMTGQTTTQAFNDITLAVARSSKMILDNLGIIVSIEEANKNYAKQIGKVASELTDVEKKQAFLNETLMKGNKLVDDIGITGVSSAEKFQKLTAAWDEFKISFGAKLKNPLIQITNLLTSMLEGITKGLDSKALERGRLAAVYEKHKGGGDHFGFVKASAYDLSRKRRENIWNPKDAKAGGIRASISDLFVSEAYAMGSAPSQYDNMERQIDENAAMKGAPNQSIALEKALNEVYKERLKLLEKKWALEDLMESKEDQIARDRSKRETEYHQKDLARMKEEEAHEMKDWAAQQLRSTEELKRYHSTREEISEIIRHGSMTDTEVELDELDKRYEYYKKYTDDIVGLDRWLMKEQKAIMGEIISDAQALDNTLKEGISSWGDSFATTLNESLWGADKTFKEIAISFGKMVTEILIRQTAMRTIFGSGGGVSGGWFGTIVKLLGVGSTAGGGASEFGSSMRTVAKGGIFDKGNLTAFAQGGIVNQPTIFPMKRGAGLMGEAGPESIMPLKRMKNGNLGVESQDSNTTNITINAIDSKSFEEVVRRNPNSIVSVVNESIMNRGPLLNTMRSTI